MNTKQKLTRLEQDMRDNALAIAGIYEKMKALDNNAANKSLSGITQYLEEKNNSLELAELADNDENHFKFGIIDKAEHEQQKLKIKSKYNN